MTMKNKRIPKSSGKHHKCLMDRSLRAPERCAAISSATARLLRFTRNDNFYRWIWGIHCLFLAIFLAFFIGNSVYASIFEMQDGVCAPGTEKAAPCVDEAKPNTTPTPPAADKNKGPESSRAVQREMNTVQGDTEPFPVHFFWGDGCPHCEEEKQFLTEMKKKYPRMKVIDYEVWYNKENAALLAKMAKAFELKASGVPVTFIGEHAYIGFSRHSRQEIEGAILECITARCIDPSLVVSGGVPVGKMQTSAANSGPSGKSEELECTEKNKTVYIPWIGNLDVSEMSLPVMTLIIGGMDSFNPCAFFVLLSLLGLLIHAQSRRKMLLIGSIFVFFSGFIYFIFMAAWLNLFLVMGQVEVITKIAGSIAMLIAVINIKDFFLFKKGISLSIPDGAKPKLFDRMRKLLKSTSIVSIFIGTAVLAIAANAYELLCTAGFPMVFTRILTLNNLSTFSYYLYLVLYNAIYVIPLSVIVIIFTVTLGKQSLTEWQGRILKLVSGTMMLGLGGLLLFDPAILSNAFVSFLLLIGAIVVSAFLAFLTKKFGKS